LWHGRVDAARELAQLRQRLLQLDLGLKETAQVFSA
jgi:hypothetical protein